MKNKFSITTTSCATGIGYTSYNRGYLKLNQFTELITNMFSARRCGYNRFARSSLEKQSEKFLQQHWHGCSVHTYIYFELSMVKK